MTSTVWVTVSSSLVRPNTIAYRSTIDNIIKISQKHCATTASTETNSVGTPHLPPVFLRCHCWGWLRRPLRFLSLLPTAKPSNTPPFFLSGLWPACVLPFPFRETMLAWCYPLWSGPRARYACENNANTSSNCIEKQNKTDLNHDLTTEGKENELVMRDLKKRSRKTFVRTKQRSKCRPSSATFIPNA